MHTLCHYITRHEAIFVPDHQRLSLFGIQRFCATNHSYPIMEMGLKLNFIPIYVILQSYNIKQISYSVFLMVKTRYYSDSNPIISEIPFVFFIYFRNVITLVNSWENNVDIYVSWTKFTKSLLLRYCFVFAIKIGKLLDIIGWHIGIDFFFSSNFHIRVGHHYRLSVWYEWIRANCAAQLSYNFSWYSVVGWQFT